MTETVANKMTLEDGHSREQMESKPSKSQNKRCMWIFAVLLFLAMAACIIALAVILVNRNKELSEAGQPQSTTTTTTQTPPDTPVPVSAAGKFRFGAVAADNEVCSKMGTMMLSKGSTIDATITTLLCLGLMNPHSCGLGGGFLATIYDSKEKKSISLISREVAPLAATEDMYVNKTGASRVGGLAIGVPGEVMGYAEMHKKYGRLPWAELFEPVIKLCEDGYPVPKALGIVILSQEAVIRDQPILGELLMKSDGTLYKEGDILKRPLLAMTLRRIADEGAETFYNGTLANDIAIEIQNNGGIITTEDLSMYKPIWKEPVSATLNNGETTLYGPPPPSSAAVLYYILNIMDGFNLSAESRQTTEQKILLAHRLVEAMKFGYGKRSYLGDEDFVNITEWKEKLRSDDFAEETRKKINDDEVLAFADYDSAFLLPDDDGTSHLSILGTDGTAVAVTTTINSYFGSKVRGNVTGILFNNEMDDFSTRGLKNAYGFLPSPTNFIVPGKHPMSSTSPTIIMDKNNNLVGVIGASGGTRIITGVIETIMNSFWLGYNVSEALDQPRYHHQLLPDEILHEPILPQEIVDGLAKKGHKFKIRTREFCVVQMIRNYCSQEPMNSYCIHAASDQRRGGIPDGI